MGGAVNIGVRLRVACYLSGKDLIAAVDML